MFKRLLIERTIIAVLAVECLAAYLPAFNNGFISDDFVILDWSQKFLAHPGFLFTVPPQNFRMTSYVVFLGLKHLAGYKPEVFYAFNLTLHFIACLLLWRLMLELGDRLTAGMTAILFAVFQAPQEAVMWLAAMNETLCAVFILATLVFWLKGKHGWGLICYSAALISKESAPILLLLLLIVQWKRDGEPLKPAYLLYFIPTAVFAAVFLKTWAANSMIRTNLYSVGPHALVVLLKSLNQLLWPWLYIALAFAWYSGHLRLTPRRSLVALALIAAPMLPYIFINYSEHLPSRQVYLASMVFVAVVAALIQSVEREKLQIVFVVGFVLFNVGYLWLKKDKQFEDRAQPTTQLLRLLQTHQPTPITIYGFAYYEPDVAKDVSWLAPGWNRDLIGLDGVGNPCPTCVKLRWEPKTQRYIGDW